MVPSSQGAYVGVTQPSKTVDLAFDNLGKVSAVEVRPGDPVEAGQTLMRQDARGEEARLRRLEEEADVTARVRVAQERRDLAALQFERAEKLLRDGGGSPVEVEEAGLERKVAETQILEEERQGRAAEASVQELQVVLDQKELASPVGGVVREVEAQVGEVFGPADARAADRRHRPAGGRGDRDPQRGRRRPGPRRHRPGPVPRRGGVPRRDRHVHRPRGRPLGRHPPHPPDPAQPRPAPGGRVGRGPFARVTRPSE